MTNNKNRLGNGMNIYDDSMRRYIAGVMQNEIDGDWFLERVINKLPDRIVYRLTETLEQEQADSSSTIGHARALEITHYPHVIRANRDIFPDLCSRNSSNVAKHGGLPLTWMHEIADWRNVHAHPPPDDLRVEDVDRVLDAMIRVLSLCDEAAAKQVRQLVSASRRPRRVLVRRATRPTEQRTAAQIEREEAHRERAFVQTEHDEAKQKLAEARQFNDDAKRMLRKAEQVREAAQQSALRTKQKLTMVREQHQELLHERRSPEPKPKCGQAITELKHYGRKFKKASTGNGWIHTTPLGDWQVTRWLGQVQGVTRACVFSPGRRTHSGWINTQQHPLVKGQFEGEEEGFAWLYEQDQTNVVQERARESILDFEKRSKQPHMVDDGFDDDIPF